MEGIFDVFGVDHSSCLLDVDVVELIVIFGVVNVPAIETAWCPIFLDGGFYMDNDPGSWRGQMVWHCS